MSLNGFYNSNLKELQHYHYIIYFNKNCFLPISNNQVKIYIHLYSMFYNQYNSSIS